jgi:cytochrome b-561
MLRRYFRIIKSLPVFQIHPVLMLIGLVALNGEGQYTPTLEL